MGKFHQATLECATLAARRCSTLARSLAVLYVLLATIAVQALVRTAPLGKLALVVVGSV